MQSASAASRQELNPVGCYRDSVALIREPYPKDNTHRL